MPRVRPSSRRPVSQRQLAAARATAQEATGPRAAKGTARPSLGILRERRRLGLGSRRAARDETTGGATKPRISTPSDADPEIAEAR